MDRQPFGEGGELVQSVRRCVPRAMFRGGERAGAVLAQRRVGSEGRVEGVILEWRELLMWMLLLLLVCGPS
jgi:hypothetical protein